MPKIDTLVVRVDNGPESAYSAATSSTYFVLPAMRFVSQCYSSLIAVGLLLALSPKSDAAYKLQQVASGLDLPVFVTQAPGDESSLYVVEQQTNDFFDTRSSGQIVRIDLTTGAKSSFLRVQNVSKAAEGGLHGLAFHPNFQANGKFYLSWVTVPRHGSDQPQLRLDEYQVQAGLPDFTRTLFDVTNIDTSGSHGINWIGFQPGASGVESDYLYVTTGDGGLQADDADFSGESQDLGSVRGKVLRIDVAASDAYPNDPSRNYGYPASNPFASDGDQATLGEIYHSGLRNPWRASFDRGTGDLYIGDVGFNTTEEINFIRAGEAGLDFGWPKREGTVETPVPGVGGELGSSVNPIFELTHNNDKGISGLGSITGGYVYRGPVEQLQGQYVFAETRARELLSGRFDRETDPIDFDGDRLTDFMSQTDQFGSVVEGSGTLDVVVSLGEDLAGHLYLIDYSIGLFANVFDAGEIYRLLPNLPADFNDDGVVNAADLAKWKIDVGQGSGSDADGDGDSDGADFLAWQQGVNNFASLVSASQAVPEPMPGGMLVSAVAICACRRERMFRDTMPS